MKDGGKVAIIVAAVLVLLVLPFGYVLSSGPALWLEKHGYLDSYIFAIIYTPLYEGLGPLDPVITWYWQLCTGEENVTVPVPVSS